MNAPYGLRADGTPRKKTGRPPGSRTRPKTVSAVGTGSSPYRQIVTGAEDQAEPEPLAEPAWPIDDAGAPAPEGPGITRDPVSSIGAMTEQAAKASAAVSKKVTVTAAVKKDIAGKLAFLMTIPAMMWSVSDPYCGGEFQQTIPPLSAALADIVTDSPDLVTWFTSGGGYMKWLTTITLLQPTLTMMWKHHVSHSIGDDDDAATDGGHYDASQYPAPPVFATA